MHRNQILGAVTLVVGLTLLGFGYHASDSAVERVSETMTGRFTDDTMWYFVVGAAASISGILLFLFARKY